MGSMLSLSLYSGKSFLRDRGVVVSQIVLPVVLLFAAKYSAPSDVLPIELDSKTIIVDAENLLMVLYSLSAVVLVASIVSFFISFNLKNIIPRLKIAGYTNLQISGSMVLIIFLVDTVISITVWLYTLSVIDVEDSTGFLVGLLFVSAVTSMVGLIIAELVQTKTLGLYVILSLLLIDTSFIENPVYSRRYNDPWIVFMPSHNSLQIILRSSYDTGVSWWDTVPSVLVYMLALFVILIFVRSRRS